MAAVVRNWCFVLFLSIFLLPLRANADWKLEKVSDLRLAAMVAEKLADSRSSQFYGIGRGHKRDQTNLYFDVPEGAAYPLGSYSLSAVTKQESPGSFVYEFSKTEYGWESSTITWHPAHGASLVAGLNCSGERALLAHFWDGKAIEMTAKGGQWRSVEAQAPRRRKPRQGENHSSSIEWPRGAAAMNASFLLSLQGIGTRRLGCQNGSWQGEDLVVNRKIDLAQVIPGKARNDGKTRLYGFLFGGGVAEVELGVGGLWQISAPILSGSSWTLSHLVIGDARNDGISRVYVGGFRELWEFEWKVDRFVGSPIAASKVDSLFSRATVGMTLGTIRGDAKNRLYIANGANIIEYSYGDGGWSHEVISPAIGEIGAIAADDRDGKTIGHLFIAGDQEGVYSLRWKGMKRVVVLPFENRTGTLLDASGYSDVLAIAIAKRSNCEVLEREKIEEILRERRLGLSGAVDPGTASVLGKLLLADAVVLGTVGRVSNTNLAVVNVVGVENALIEGSAYGHWTNLPEARIALERIAGRLCHTERIVN